VGLLSLNLTPPTDNSQAATSTFATGPATISISTSPEAVSFGEVSGGSATKTQAITVTTTSVAGYTLSQNFGDSAATQTSATSGTSTAKWVTSGALTKNGGTATIPVALSHSFNVANEDQHDFTYSVTVTDAQHMPAGVYSGKSVYTAVAKLPSAPTLASATPTEFAVGSVSGNLTLTGANLDSVYQVYLGDTNDETIRCVIDTSVTRTATTLACKAPTELAKGEYTIHLIYQGGEVATTSKVSYIKKSICTNADPESECTVDIDANMIPVKYTGDSVTPKWVVADKSVKGDWYNYGDKKWANAVTVKSDKLSTYKAASAGTPVSNDDVLGYFVYIPRYKYKVMTMSGSTTPTATNFEIQFEKNSATKSVPSAVGDWATHPAFTWGDTELNGFWMGKFETTGKISSPTIKPNQVANISKTIGQKFTSAASIGVDDPTADTMGSSVSNVTKNGHNLLTATSHLLKNSEWGAAAYLSASEFGAGYNGVYNNGRYAYANGNTYDEDGNQASGGITGCGPNAKGTDINTGSVSTYRGTHLTQSSPVSDTACSIDNKHAYNQELGVLASTTNNVYGVYDMAGGSWEYVMGSYTATDGQSATKSVSYAVKPPYVDLYLNLTSTTNCKWATCGGAALYETAGWGLDSSHFFVYSYNPWLIRGGGAYSDSDAGVFALFYSVGNSDFNSDSFRVGLRLPASAPSEEGGGRHSN